MEDLNSRLGYLKGLAEGLGINDETKEGKIIRQIIMIIEDIVGTVEDLKEDHDELFSYVEALDEDLSELEEAYMDDEDDHYDDHDDNIYDVPFTVECPECRQEVAIDEDILEDEDALEVLCPGCGKVVFTNDEDWDAEIEADFEDDEGKN